MLEPDYFSLILSFFTEFQVIRVSSNIIISVFQENHYLWNIQSKNHTPLKKCLCNLVVMIKHH